MNGPRRWRDDPGLARRTGIDLRAESRLPVGDLSATRRSVLEAAQRGALPSVDPTSGMLWHPIGGLLVALAVVGGGLWVGVTSSTPAQVTRYEAQHSIAPPHSKGAVEEAPSERQDMPAAPPPAAVTPALEPSSVRVDTRVAPERARRPTRVRKTQKAPREVRRSATAPFAPPAALAEPDVEPEAPAAPKVPLAMPVQTRSELRRDLLAELQSTSKLKVFK